MTFGAQMFDVLHSAQREMYGHTQEPADDDYFEQPIRISDGERTVEGLIFIEFDDVWIIWADGMLEEYKKSEWRIVWDEFDD